MIGTPPALVVAGLPPRRRPRCHRRTAHLPAL